MRRSAQRREKEKAMHERFEKRIEAGLEKIAAGCAKRRLKRSSPRHERLRKLNQVAIHQMKLLTQDLGIRQLKSGKE